MSRCVFIKIQWKNEIISIFGALYLWIYLWIRFLFWILFVFLLDGMKYFHQRFSDSKWCKNVPDRGHRMTMNTTGGGHWIRKVSGNRKTTKSFGQQNRYQQGAPNDLEYLKQENNKILWSAKPLPTGGTEWPFRCLDWRCDGKPLPTACQIGAMENRYQQPAK